MYQSVEYKLIWHFSKFISYCRYVILFVVTQHNTYTKSKLTILLFRCETSIHEQWFRKIIRFQLCLQ